MGHVWDVRTDAGSANGRATLFRRERWIINPRRPAAPLYISRAVQRQAGGDDPPSTMVADHHASPDESRRHDLSGSRHRRASHQETAPACKNRQSIATASGALARQRRAPFGRIAYRRTIAIAGYALNTAFCARTNYASNVAEQAHPPTPTFAGSYHLTGLHSFHWEAGPTGFRQGTLKPIPVPIV